MISSQNHKPGRPPLLSRQSQSPACRQAEMLRRNIAENNSQCARFQGFLQSPEQGHGFAQGEAQEAPPGKPQLFNAMAIAAAIFPHLSFETTP
jgi:hypothetical protein